MTTTRATEPTRTRGTRDAWNAAEREHGSDEKKVRRSKPPRRTDERVEAAGPTCA